MPSMKESSELHDLLHQHSRQLVGAAVAVVDRDGFIEYATYGKPDVDADEPVTSKTPFFLASAAKTITATLIGQLVDQGKLSLDDPLVKWLPEAEPICRGAEPTFRQLLSHSAGYVDFYGPFETLQDFIPAVGQQELLAPPGQLFSYGNTPYVLLAAAASKITGKTWFQPVRSNILTPLKLSDVQLGDEVPTRSARFHVFDSAGKAAGAPDFPKFPFFAPAGSTPIASLEDAIVLTGAILLGTHGSLLSPGMRKTMQTLQVRTPGPSPVCQGWGAGWAVVDESQGVVGHLGAVSAYIVGSSSLGKAVCYLSNSPSVGDVGIAVAHKILGIASPPPAQISNANEPTRSQLIGDYACPLFGFEVKEKHTKLIAINSFAPDDVELEHVGGGNFTGQVMSLKTEFDFLGIEDGKPAEYLFVTLRVLKRRL